MKFIPAKTILSSYTEGNSWFGNNYTMNIYRGCSHGCIYCDSRSECYRIDNFDEVRAKENSLILLERELRSKRKTGVIGMGAMSDPYNPREKEQQLTRRSLELINTYQYGVTISTKSNLITRDIDILKSIKKHSPVLVNITITTYDDNLSSKVEPNVALSSERFSAVKELSDNGIFVGVLLMPVLPFIEDNIENIVNIIELAHKNGASFIFPSFGVTLRQNQREWFYNKLNKHFPGIKEKYIKEYGNSYACNSPISKQLSEIFKQECNTRGILYKMKDIITAYKKDYEINQLSLFD